MTPKEKAKELVNKMKLATDEFGYININTERHKQCAVIAVDEILNSVKNNFIYSIKFHERWKEVKQEIENYNG